MYVKKTGAAKYYCSERCYKYDSVQRKKQRPKEQAEIARIVAEVLARRIENAVDLDRDHVVILKPSRSFSTSSSWV